MKYTIEKIRSMYTKKVIILIFLIPILIFLAIQDPIRVVFLENYSLKDVYIFTINQSIFFFVPVITIYFYNIRNISLETYEKSYVYKFKYKLKLLKINLISNFLFTFIFVFSINLVLVCLFLTTKLSTMNIEFVKIFLISNLLQILVLYIYNLIFLMCNCIFIKYNSEVTMVLNIIIIISGVLKGNLDIFGGFSLYIFFTELNLLKYGLNNILGISLLIIFIFILIDILKILYKSDFLKYLNTDNL